MLDAHRHRRTIVKQLDAVGFEKAQRVWYFALQDPAIFDVGKSFGNFLHLADEQGIEAVILAGPKP